MAPSHNADLWDELDEDWVEHPPSSLSLPPLGSPAPARSSPTAAVAKSRIPRFANRRSSITRSPPRSAALKERSANIPPPHSSAERKLDQQKPTNDSRPSTNSSSGSVIHHGGESVIRKQKEPVSTPEWKKALRKQDLFSSTTGLEHIFQKPDETPTASPLRQGYSFTDEQASMPSSPPIALQAPPAVSPDQQSLCRPSQALQDIVEEDEDGNDVLKGSLNQQQVQKYDKPASQAPQAHSTTTSSSVADFSPVFISKHNTIDGKVNYAAFDPTELPKLSEFVNVSRGGVEEDASFHRKQLSSADSAALASDSVAPSDSVSQVGLRLNSNATGSHNLAILSPIKEDTRRPLSAPTPSQHSQTVSLTFPALSQSNKSSVETAFRPVDNSSSKASGEEPLVHSSSESDVNRPASAIVGSQMSSDNLPPIVGRKRKDARYDQRSVASNPSLIAKREILRPRNSGMRSNLQPQSNPQGSSVRLTDSLREKFEKESSVNENQNAVRARALASEVAAYRLEPSHPRLGSFRKQSLCTQDYLNEAMKIMELIRARKDVPSEADSSEQAASQAGQGQKDGIMFSPDSFSRPPSRDGPRSGWRSERQMQIDPQVLNHLKKYEETGDESFLVSSIVRSVRAAETQASFAGSEGSEDRPDLAELQSHRSRRFSDSMLSHADQQVLSSPIKTQNSQRSTGSGDTLATTSTQRARNMKTIGPENISHLIRDEEAGMRFDNKTLSWIRQRKQRVRPSAGPSSSTGTEANVLNEIPDLSVNEALETERSRVFSGQRQPWPATTSEVNEEATFAQEHLEVSEEDEFDSFVHPETHDQERSSHFAATRDQLDAGDVEVVPTVEHSTDKDVEYIQAWNPRERKREQSVLFSSPPVSKEYDAKDWTDSPGAQYDTVHDRDDEDEDEEHEDVSALSRTEPFGSRGLGRLQSQTSTRARSHSHLFESHEISFQEPGPNGRTMSMSMSIATPVGNRRSAAIPALASASIAQQQGFMKALSPMSAFSEHQSDERHRESLALGQSLLRVRHQQSGLRAEAAQATQEMMRHLTDVEPDEPWWDWMHRLDLSKREMTTAHSLDVVCPRLEYLDASSNKLAHLQGLPETLRTLTISHNKLTGLTNWSHLPNLQYLDVSFNELSSLDGLGGLIHLRKLSASHNKVTSVTGILDLDGLLSVNLANNLIEAVDFRTSSLKRLTNVDLGGNALEEVLGLEELASLEQLNLEDNRLTYLEGNESITLRELKVSRNRLDRFSVAGFPHLENLEADGNSLSKVDDVHDHPSLKVMKLCNQSVKEMRDFSAYCNLEELHLSRSALPIHLPMKQPFLRLRFLDVAHTGIQSFPADFGLLAPNLQTLNMNSCHVKELRPLLGIVGLRRLFCVGNRLARLRSTVRVLRGLSNLRGGVLEEIDFRGNPLVHGFYAATDGTGSINSRTEAEQVTADDLAVQDSKYAERLDDDTKMRRRIWELLVASKCTKLKQLDGLAFDKTRIERRDDVWDMLVGNGVVQATC